MTTMMVMDIIDDDDECDNAILTMCDKGDNCNCDDGEDACALTATTPAHRRRRQHSQSRDGGTSRGGGGVKKCDTTINWHEQRGGVEDGRVRRLCDER